MITISKFKLVFKMITMVVFFLGFTTVFAQDKLKTMPGYERYAEIAPKIRGSVKMAPTRYTWSEDSKTFEYTHDGKHMQFNVKSGKAEEIEEKNPTENRRRSKRPQRGRQYASADSPDGKLKAFTRDRNMYISNLDGTNEMPITKDGNENTQLKYGIATWVYGEELGQITAMWWSPDSKKVAFYRFEEKEAEMYYVLYNQVKIQDSVEIEAYPKVGANNLPVDIMVYDLETKQTTLIDTRNDQPFNDGNLGTYLYGMNWTPDGKEFLFHSTNRKQDIMEYRASDPVTGKTRTVVREEWLASFTKNTPEMHALEDGQHFIWASERSGFNNYYLYNFDGTLVNAITSHNFEVNRILKVDEKNKTLYYEARSGENHMKMQLHRVELNGKNDTQLTDAEFHHSVTISPDGKYFIDVAQTHDKAPVANLINAKGKKVAEIAKSDTS